MSFFFFIFKESLHYVVLRNIGCNSYSTYSSVSGTENIAINRLEIRRAEYLPILNSERDRKLNLFRAGNGYRKTKFQFLFTKSKGR